MKFIDLLLFWAPLINTTMILLLGLWVVLTVTRMRHEQAVVVATIEALAVKEGLRSAIADLKQEMQAREEKK